MSGGSVDNHTCIFDENETMWLPLYYNNHIIQQPLRVQDLAQSYASQADAFIRRNAEQSKQFFLYLAFSHVHQLCAPRFLSEQSTCQWSSKSQNGEEKLTFTDAIEEMDWIAGQILKSLEESDVTNNTLVIFTSNNGPWVAEKTCSGLKGPFEGSWLRDNVDIECTACPHDYVASPIEEQPRCCVLPGSTQTLDGVHCGEDTGLGSVWEANLRMPSLARWPAKIAAGSELIALVSTLDILPTILSIIETTNSTTLDELDGLDISPLLFGNKFDKSDNRILFFWRYGFDDGPLPQPYGRFDVVAVKLGRIKAWFWIKSAHNNYDSPVFHDPPLLFDVIQDPAESQPLNQHDFVSFIELIKQKVFEHKATVDWNNPGPLLLLHNPKVFPCVDYSMGCRTDQEYSVIA